MTVVIGTIPPCNSEALRGCTSTNQTVVDNFNNIVRRVSFENQVCYADIFFDAFSGVYNSSYFVDGLHPNELGHQMMNTTFHEAFVNCEVFDCDSAPTDCYNYTTTSSCAVPISGNWEINCSDNCTFVNTKNIPANVTIEGNGTLRFVSNGLWNVEAEDGYIRGVDDGDTCSIVFSKTWLRTN
jgi:hypothetical protein